MPCVRPLCSAISLQQLLPTALPMFDVLADQPDIAGTAFLWHTALDNEPLDGNATF